MMDKVLVEVFVPSLGGAFDAFIPLRLPMYEVLSLLKKAVADLSGNCLAVDDSTVICHREDGKILDINKSVHELGIQNGSKLMLI